MRWFTADLHFGHANIIRYCDRPFADVDTMNSALIANWNATVDEDDEVWVLGDVAMGKIDPSLLLVGSLHGRKILVVGNHDRCWEGNGAKAEGWTERYRDAGFDEIHQGAVSTTIGGTEVLAAHLPYEGDSHDADRFVGFRPVDDGRWLLHGHVHTSWQVNGRQINVGTDVWDYAPVAESILSAIIDEH